MHLHFHAKSADPARDWKEWLQVVVVDSSRRQLRILIVACAFQGETKSAEIEVDESEYVKVEKSDADQEEHFHKEEVIDQPLRAAWQYFDR